MFLIVNNLQFDFIFVTCAIVKENWNTYLIWQEHNKHFN